jgi:hypothetical protein
MDDNNYLNIHAAVTIPALQALTSALFVGGAENAIILEVSPKFFAS